MSKQKPQEQAQEPIADRRCHARYAIKGGIVEYINVEFLAFTDKNMRKRDDLSNVSEGGMLFLAGQDFPVGQCLSLCLEMPGRAKSLKMRGAVVWTRQAKKAGRYEVGVKFSMCAPDAAETLRNLPQECERCPNRVVLYVGNN